jgi:prolyl 4-hydroxylase
MVIRFLPDLADWLVAGLEQGQPPAAMVKRMIDERMQPRVAQAIVAAFVEARQSGRPVPVDAVVVDEELGAPPVPAATRLRPGPRFETGDRPVRVLARGDSPTLALLSGLMSDAECEELMALAGPRLRPSTVVDPETGHDVVAAYRNSVGMFFRPGENQLVARLDRRFSEVMGLPLENGEGIQVLRYQAGGGTAPHHDYLVPSNPANAASLARSGQRVSTLITYLNDVPGGGETVFPLAGWSVTPQRGSSLYFESCDDAGQVDHRSLHTGNPVASGEKWIATKWMRQRRFVSAG